MQRESMHRRAMQRSKRKRISLSQCKNISPYVKYKNPLFLKNLNASIK
jgi:hypothetical protein